MDKLSLPLIGVIVIGLGIIGVSAFAVLNKDNGSARLGTDQERQEETNDLYEMEYSNSVDEVRLPATEPPPRPDRVVPSSSSSSSSGSKPTPSSTSSSSSSSSSSGGTKPGSLPPPPPPPTNAMLTPAPTGPLSFASLNASTREAVVNVYCESLSGGPLRPISASGVIISPSGIVLTNAHVAQYLLLKDYIVPNYITCIIRTGSPAYPAYKAELLYIAPGWVKANAHKIEASDPRGTGEYDFAFLRITGTIDPNGKLPAAFPYIAPDIAEDSIETGAGVLVAGYPAGFLGASTVIRELYASSAFSTIGEIFTFVKSSSDLFSVGNTVLAQKGSSGGAVVSMLGKLIGLVVTTSQGGTTGTSDLRAISMFYINRAFAEDAGITLDGIIKSDPAAYAKIFNDTKAPALTKLLTDEIEK